MLVFSVHLRHFKLIRLFACTDWLWWLRESTQSSRGSPLE